jgi:DNA repair exonuclease SbcCD nuclease subunit
LPLTFIHSSDWHLGKGYERIGRHATQARKWRFDAVRKTYEVALEAGASFILVAGDVFQSDTPRPELVEQAAELLKEAPVPIVVIPGNHDPATEGSVWFRDELAGRVRGLGNVRLALKPEPIEFPEWHTVVFPCPVPQKILPEDASAWIPHEQRGNRYRVGLAHGFLNRYDGQERFENFIAADRADVSGLDYLALGDFHSYTLDSHPAAARRTRYSGTVECTAVDEDRPGHVLIVRIDSPGAEPNVSAIRVGRMRPVQLPRFELSPGASLEPLIQAVEAVEQPENVLLGLSVRGALSPEELASFRDWMAGLYGRFLGVESDDAFLVEEPGPAQFAAIGLDAAEARVVSLLQSPQGAQSALPADDEILQACASSPEVLREARSLLYGYLKEARST